MASHTRCHISTPGTGLVYQAQGSPLQEAARQVRAECKAQQSDQPIDDYADVEIVSVRTFGLAYRFQDRPVLPRRMDGQQYGQSIGRINAFFPTSARDHQYR